jgi:hypothetical protein
MDPKIKRYEINDQLFNDISAYCPVVHIRENSEIQ